MPLLLFIALFVAVTAHAGPILVSQGNTRDGYGLRRWEQMTDVLNGVAGGDIQVTPTLDDLSLLLSFDSPWVDQRGVAGRLSALEIRNLTSYISTGRRVVMIGENQAWEAWNMDILAAVGGDPIHGTSAVGTTAPIGSQFLTAGVNHVSLPSTGVAFGGLPLFDTNFATLWGPQRNASLLWTRTSSALIVGICWVTRSSRTTLQAGSPTVTWPSTPVPAPSSLLLGVGAAVLIRSRMERIRNETARRRCEPQLTRCGT
jgi:hypothetical protein